MMKRTVPFLALSVLAIWVLPIRGAIILVPADQPTIQSGVDSAADLDTVLVAPGTYVENVLIDSKSIYLTSRYMTSLDTADISHTVIDGSSPTSPDTGSVIRIVNGAGTVRGFTITGGTGTLWRDVSDGLLYREGGGILTEGGSPRIQDNLIIANEAIKTSGGARSAGGGAIRCGFGSAEILHNVIAHNRGLYGGGVVAFHNPVTMRNNIVFANSGGEAFGGGGIWITSSTSGTNVLENNTVMYNRSAVDGGGLLLWANGATLRNNIFWANEATTGPQIQQRSGTAVSVQYCDIQDNWTGTGNIDLDPGADVAAFLLSPASPCVDAGNPGLLYNDPEAPGQAGWARYPAMGTTRNDAGAYGGRGSASFPVFNAPSIGLSHEEMDLGEVEVGGTEARWVQVTKSAFGLCRVDSIKFSGAHASDFAVPSVIPLVLGPQIDDALDSAEILWMPTTYGSLEDTAWVFHNDPVTPNPIPMVLTGTVPGATGDPNMDDVINTADIIYLVNFVFKSGPAPKPVQRSGDTNCDGSVTSSDVIYLVNFVFRGGPAPCG